MRYKKMKSSQLIYCPVLKSTLLLSTDELDNISMLSKFILFCFGNGADRDIIKEVTMLQGAVIEEEILLLQKEGIIETDFYGLTELGKKYFKLIVLIDDFNKCKHTVQIDQTTGRIISDDSKVVNKNDRINEMFSLQDKLVDYIYRNRDAANSKEFLFDNFNLDIDNEEKALIHTELLIDDDDLYREMNLIFVPCEDEESKIISIDEEAEEINLSNIDKHKIFVEKTYIKINIEIVNKMLNKHEKVLKEIQYLYDEDESLLSDKALNLIRKIEELKSLNNNLGYLYLDGQTGEILSSIATSNFKSINPKKKINLPLFYDINNLNPNIFNAILERYSLESSENFEVIIGKTEYIQKIYEVSISETIDFYIENSIPIIEMLKKI